MARSITVADLLPEKLDGLGAAAREALRKDAQVAGQQLAWNFVSSRLESALREALGCDLFQVFASGWANSPLVKAYVAAMTEPSTKLRFGQHGLTREIKPTIAVTIGDCPCIELEFTVALAAQFSGLTLDIENRRITGGNSGALSASAALSFGDISLHQATSREFDLPGEFRLAEPGIAIALP